MVLAQWRRLVLGDWKSGRTEARRSWSEIEGAVWGWTVKFGGEGFGCSGGARMRRRRKLLLVVLVLVFSLVGNEVLPRWWFDTSVTASIGVVNCGHWKLNT